MADESQLLSVITPTILELWMQTAVLTEYLSTVQPLILE